MWPGLIYKSWFFEFLVSRMSESFTDTSCNRGISSNYSASDGTQTTSDDQSDDSTRYTVNFSFMTNTSFSMFPLNCTEHDYKLTLSSIKVKSSSKTIRVSLSFLEPCGRKRDYFMYASWYSFY